MYLKKLIFSGQVLEVEKICSFKYKGKKTLRGSKMEKTPENMRKVNDRNACKKLQRLINTNFGANDLHTVLTYAPENRAENPAEAKKDLQKFFRKLKREYKKAGKELKYVAVTEYGQRSMHHHLVINSGLDVAVMQKLWGLGKIRFTLLDDSGDYDRLAQYLLKQTRKTFNDPEKSVFAKRWCASRNLARPTVEPSVVKADSWRERPVAPKGYFVITDSIKEGVSDVTGWPYQYYKCLKIRNDVLKTGADRRRDASDRIKRRRERG